MAVNCMMWLGERIQKVEEEILHGRENYITAEIAKSASREADFKQTEEINE